VRPLLWLALVGYCLHIPNRLPSIWHVVLVTGVTSWLGYYVSLLQAASVQALPSGASQVHAGRAIQRRADQAVVLCVGERKGLCVAGWRPVEFVDVCV
jgi:hypothetical protein